ncbi:class E sortase [Streptomyces sp. cg36]|uniref:class E sortase n=1 Tax=Streptomyces sp. cg36 TaxID=3238798 RepID=UPI0034E21CAB
MTAVRPEHEFDPLTDPLPAGGHGSPWFRADTLAQAPQGGHARVAEPGADSAPEPPAPFQERPRPGRHAAGPARQGARAAQQQPQDWYADPGPEPDPASIPGAADPVAYPAPFDDATVALAPISGEPAPPTGGRAERRRAARAKGHRGAAAPASSSASTAAGDAPGRPLTRVEARRAAKARKDSPAVIASRLIGELFITLGVVMLLFVTYQLWWTNVRAHQQAGNEAKKITHGWESGKTTAPGAFEPGQGFAIMHIPKLDVVVPVAEGTSKHKVLDKGMVGHYGQGSLKTAMPGDRTGNFAVAGHRNTHGEPFRYINRLKPGDLVIVETQQAYYTYAITSTLPSTSPKNVSVLKPIPVGSGFTRPGRYLTLTTCTPEFTSTYRMIVWGKMVDERPRSKGLPDALAG